MAKIKIAVAGCLGRMGQEISKQILQNKNLEFVGGFEHKKHKDINKPLNKVSAIQSSKLVTANAAQLIKEANVEIPVNLNSKQKEILREFENEGGTSKKHSPKSQGFFSKLKEVWEDLT